MDTSCILYGEIGLTPLAPNLIIGGNDLGNRSIWVMGLICLAIIFLVSLFYKQLLLTSFDAILAHSIGWPVKLIHLLLMMFLALSTVASLESVGVILVVAMLVFPSVTASFFFQSVICYFILHFSSWNNLHIWRISPGLLVGLLYCCCDGYHGNCMFYFCLSLGPQLISLEIFGQKKGPSFKRASLN